MSSISFVFPACFRSISCCDGKIPPEKKNDWAETKLQVAGKSKDFGHSSAFSFCFRFTPECSQLFRAFHFFSALI